MELSRKETAGIRLGSWECSGEVCTLAEFISGASLGVSDNTAVPQADTPDIVRAFRQRILSNYDDFLYEWLHSEPEQLISYAEEIAATKHMRGTALSFTDANELQYLMRFQNPLKVLRDHCLTLETFDRYAIPDLMERIMADTDAIRQYEPDEAYAQPEESQRQSM